MRRTCREFAATAGLALVIVVVPWLLASVGGWPLPSKPPDAANMWWTARQRALPAAFAVKSLAAIAWLAWIQLAWALTWEIVVNVPRHRRGQSGVSAPWSPRAATRAARALLGPLVFAVTLGSSGHVAGAAGTGGAPAAVVAWSAEEMPRLPPSAPPRGEPRPEPGADLTAGHAVYVVEPGDTLWDIAGEQLDDPLRWREIFDANVGSQFDDGRALVDPGLIRPGWELVIPHDPGAPGSPAAELPDAAAGDPVPDDAMGADPAGPVDAPGGAAPEPAPAPAASPPPWAPPPGRRLADATPTPPPPDEPEPVSVPPGEPQTAGARPVNRWSQPLAPTERWAPPSAPDPNPVTERSAAGVDVVSMDRAAMMSAGALLLLGARRRQRLRSAPIGARPVASQPAEATLERALRAIQPGERFARVDLAVRAAALHLVRDGQRPLAVLVAPDGALELRVTGPTDLPAPWKGDGTHWILPATTSLEELAADARRVGAPTPLLVQLGCDGPRDVYVDLEALGALQVDAEPAVADSIVNAIATTLATSVLAEVATLVGVEVAGDAFCGHRHQVGAGDVPEALAAAVDAAGCTVAARCPTFELRARATGGEAWEPAAVLVGSAAGVAVLPFVPTGVAVVSAAPIVGPASVLARAGHTWTLQPVGIRLVPIGLPGDQVEGVAALLDAPVVTPSDPAVMTAPPASVPPRERRPAPALLVRLIGRVRVETASGRPVAFERSKTLELIAWLATHRPRSTRRLARTAMWELDVRHATFANVVSEARRALARAVPPPDGEEWVGRTMTDELPLHPLVCTDAELLADALDAARAMPPAEAIEVLRPAVDLLAGAPFEGTDYLWPDPEGITSRMVMLAITAAGELAERCLAIGDVAGVFAATERGLRVLPGHEELIGLRMRAYGRTGDHAGVRHEFEAYTRSLLADPWSDGEPSPKLVRLRADLLGR